MGHTERQGDEGRRGDATLWAIAGASYFTALALIAALYPLRVFPYLPTSAPSRVLAVVGAALSVASIAYVRGGYRVPGNIAAGLFGALAGIGALFLPTVSVLTGLADVFLPTLFLLSQLVLIALADFDCGRFGRVSSLSEGAIAVILGLAVIAPTLCLFLARS